MLRTPNFTRRAAVPLLVLAMFAFAGCEDVERERWKHCDQECSRLTVNWTVETDGELLDCSDTIVGDVTVSLLPEDGEAIGLGGRDVCDSQTIDIEAILPGNWEIAVRFMKSPGLLDPGLNETVINKVVFPHSFVANESASFDVSYDVLNPTF